MAKRIGDVVTEVPGLVDATGRSGWTVYSFANGADAARFVSDFASLAMPCWKRFDVIDGVLTLAR